MATRVSIEGTGPSYASVLNLGGVESNKENIESTESVVETPPRHDNEEEEGFVPVISHTRRPAKHRRDRERRAQPRPPKAPQASHTDSQPAADQAQSSEDQPKKFVEAPIPKVNPWQVRGGSTGVPPPLPPVLHDAEKRSPLLPQQQQPKPPPTPEPVIPVAPKPTVVKAVKTTKVNQKASDFTDIGDWPTLGAAVAGARCHSTPPPHEADPTHHNGNADQERKPPEEPKPEKVEQVNHQPNVERHTQNDKNKTFGGGKGGNKSGKHKWVPLDIDVKAARPGKHGMQHTPRTDNETMSLNGEDTRGRGGMRGRGASRARGVRRGMPRPASVHSHPHQLYQHHEYTHHDMAQGLVLHYGLGALGPPGALPPALGPQLAQAYYFGAAAATGTPYGMGLDQGTLKDLIKKQIEYYFSPENLSRDFFLRRKMAPDGTIPVTLIASFHRVRALTADVQLVLDAIRDSEKLQLLQAFKVRTAFEPTKWPILDITTGNNDESTEKQTKTDEHEQVEDKTSEEPEKVDENKSDVAKPIENEPEADGNKVAETKEVKEAVDAECEEKRIEEPPSMNKDSDEKPKTEEVSLASQTEQPSSTSTPQPPGDAAATPEGSAEEKMLGIFPLATMGGPLVAPVSSLLRCVPPPPLPRMFRSRVGAVSPVAHENLNPDVPEFIPQGIKTQDSEAPKPEQVSTPSSPAAQKGDPEAWTELAPASEVLRPAARNRKPRLLIVTQTTTRQPKHDGYDRQGDWCTRTKITQDLEQVITDGLRLSHRVADQSRAVRGDRAAGATPQPEASVRTRPAME
ncbi:unnamed protein product [Leptidea sinapis]|uniref:HTH La-type RNA-binding domain-containing protein n=1 Tax=Leptidea sinapis TaxID=189913 RepID=A0A5E4PZV4_9NEOP|nr:unnamed protein product [Leptidea sinapis]